MTEEVRFDLTPEESFDDFEALWETQANDDEIFDYDAPAESGIIRADPEEFPTMAELADISAAIDALPAEQRIEILFDNMSTQRKLLLAILAQCETPQDNEELTAFIAQLQETNRSIFTPDGVLHHLHRAGALARQTAEGEDYETVDLSPRTVTDEFGVEFLEATEPPAIYWVTTPEGAAVVAENKPAEGLQTLLAEESQYAHIYRIVLENAAVGNGTTEKLLGPIVNNDPALKSPRMYVPRFFDKLDYYSAIAWNGQAWAITDLGREALEGLRQATTATE